jgi:hypothetical protein
MMCEFVGFTFADESRGTRRRHLLNSIANDLCARGCSQFGKLSQRFVRLKAVARFELNPHEKNPLSPPVPCLDQCFQIAAFGTLSFYLLI